MSEIFTKNIILAVLLTAAMFPFVMNAQNLIKNGDAESDIENWNPIQVQVATDNPHSGKNCFKTKSTHIFSSAVIPVDETKTYKYSGWFKSADDKTPTVFLAILPLDADKRQINSPEITPVAGTETELTEACKPQDTVVKVKDAGEWKFADKIDVIAFNILNDYKDLPNKNISPVITKAENKNNVWELTLDKPCGKTYPAETKIRQHKYDSSFMYPAVIAKFQSKDWTELTGGIRGMSKSGTSGEQFWNGTKYIQIVILALGEGMIYFDDIKLEKQK